MKDYTVYCINCGSNQRLRMMPHRNADEKMVGMMPHGNADEKMVGWIFVCNHCEAYMADKTLHLINQSSRLERPAVELSVIFLGGKYGV